VAVGQASSHTSLASLIDGYCRRVCAAVLEQHEANSISSPLGIWLLLATCASAAKAEDRRGLEDALGCSSLQAADLLVRFLEDPPPALRSGLALWVRNADATPALVQWSATLPTQVERGDIPSQVAADAWADRHTLGLIKRFPSQLTHLTRLVLSSVLATKVSWQESFEVVSAQDHLRPSSPWRDQVAHVLLDRQHHRLPMMLATTEAAGVVAVHFALANEDLAVISVAADPEIDRRVAFEAAYEIARLCRVDGLTSAGCSLFDLPVGSGHSWEITEREVLTRKVGERSEQIEGAVLAAWHAESALKLEASEAFGIRPALSALFGLIGPDPRGDEVEAAQVAVASYTPTGFEAAAISAALLSARGAPPKERGLLRAARLCFDHPYAAVALAGGRSDFTRARAGHTESFCLPLFSAWVSTPHDPEANSPT
jgi:hypothetical protein